MLFLFSEEVSWHADVTFHEDGTAFYTEPAAPGEYDLTGSWILEGDQLTYDMDEFPDNVNYVLTGTVSGNQMEGTFTYSITNSEENVQHLPWQAVMYEE